MPRIPFAVHSYRHRSLPVSAQRCLNWMAEAEPADAKSKLVLLPTPGLTVFSTIGSGPIRGVHIMGQYLFAVSGPGVYRVDVTGVSVLIGSIVSGGPVTMADNGTQLVIVTPETSQGWVATTSSVAVISDTDFPGASSVTALDGYGIFTRPDSTEFFLSDLNDMSSFDALEFASAEADPDNLMLAKRVGRELWLFGERTTEIWSNTGAADFPLQRISGAFVERGTAARNSVAQRLSVPFWLGDDRVVYRGQGTSPERISTHAVEQAIAGYSIVSDARAFMYEQEGHVFYVLGFPDAGATWVYDMATGVWHERESEGYERWRIGCAVTFGGAVIGGDVSTGQLFIVDPQAGSEDGADIIRVAVGSPLHAGGKRMAYREMLIDMETGVGASTGQGSDPQVFLSWSDDGGRSFDHEITRTLGAIGAYRTRVKFNRLGSARDRVFRLSMSDPVRTSIMAAEIDAAPLAF